MPTKKGTKRAKPPGEERARDGSNSEEKKWCEQTEARVATDTQEIAAIRAGLVAERAELTTREADLAARYAEFATREAEFAAREKELDKRNARAARGERKEAKPVVKVSAQSDASMSRFLSRTEDDFDVAVAPGGYMYIRSIYNDNLRKG